MKLVSIIYATNKLINNDPIIQLSNVFVVQYWKSYFLNVGYDQAHEMNNKILKSKNGFGDLFNEKKTGFLKKWGIIAPEINHFLRLAESKMEWEKVSTMKRCHNFLFSSSKMPVSVPECCYQPFSGVRPQTID